MWNFVIDWWDMVYLVFGLARSGTSLTARILHELGVPMGEKMVPTKTDWCRDGFYEDEEFDTLCRRMFNKLDVSDGKITRIEPASLLVDFRSLVKRRNEKYPKWGVKNLAIMYFVKDFCSWSGEVSLIMCRRPFIECVESHAARKNIHLAQCAQEAGISLLWTERTYRTFVGPKIEVHYHDLLNAPEEQVRRLAEFCDLPFKQEAAACVDPTQKRF